VICGDAGVEIDKRRSAQKSEKEWNLQLGGVNKHQLGCFVFEFLFTD
jgi:hypothetical protein